MKKLLISLTLLMVTGITVTSCLKDPKTPDPGYDVFGIGSKATVAFETPLDVFLQADRAIRSQRDSIIAKHINQATFSYSIGYIGFTVSPADTTTYPKTIVVDFGAGPTTADKPYKGKMTIVVNGSMRIKGSTCAVSYQGLFTDLSDITGNDDMISLGINASGSVMTQFNMHGSDLKDANSKLIHYDGIIVGRFNQLSGTNVIDSVGINATDVNMVDYRISSLPAYKLQVVSGCNYFNAGVISADFKVNGILVGNLDYDFGYSTTTVNACDDMGLAYASSKINLNYQQQFGFPAKEFK